MVTTGKKGEGGDQGGTQNGLGPTDTGNSPFQIQMLNIQVFMVLLFSKSYTYVKVSFYMFGIQ